MSTIADLPYLRAEFDKEGLLLKPVTVPKGTTDLLVMSHGWRNSADEANELYTTLVTHMAQQGLPGTGAGRRYAFVGIFWPSRNFDGLVAVQDGGKGGNAVAIGETQSDAASRGKLADQLKTLEEFATTPDQTAALETAISLIPDLDRKPSARKAFIQSLCSLAGKPAKGDEDAADIFVSRDPEDIFQMFNLGTAAISRPPASATLTVDPAAASSAAATGEAAGFFDKLKGATAAASNAASYLTYYMMKNRAGTVGQAGVAPLLDRLAGLQGVERLHLVGHSFGARVVTAAALASHTAKIHSLCLLQAAFSHNGFSRSMKGLFRPVIENSRVHGPIVITHTRNDTAVGNTYALASRVALQSTSAIGDKDDKYGGLGSNGAQKMNEGEVVAGKLLAVGKRYPFTARIHNLLADEFIANHGDVAGKEVASAVNQVIA